VSIVDRIEARFDQSVDRFRKRSRLFDHAWQAIERFNDVDGGRLAAAISYYAFFAAFSLAVLGYSILGRLLGTPDSPVFAQVNKYLEDSLPWVVTTAQQVGRGEVTAIAAVALLLSGIGWVEALRSSQRAVWLVNQHPGSWLFRQVIDLGMLLGLGVLLGLSLATTGAIDKVVDWIAPDTNLGHFLARPFGPLLEFLVNLTLASALLAAVPRLRLSPRRLLPAALVVAAGIQLLNTVGRLVIARSEQRPAYYLVAGAVGLLVYLYLLNQLIIFGAALAATSTGGTVTDLAGNVPPPPAQPYEPVENLGEPRESGPEKPR
jgi:membrane protein